MKYKATFGNTEFIRNTKHEYATAGIYRNIQTGELHGKPSFAKAGNTPQPYHPAGEPVTERRFFRIYPRSVKYRAIFEKRLARYNEKAKHWELVIVPVKKA